MSGENEVSASIESFEIQDSKLITDTVKTQEPKSRTPSGNVVSHSVKDIVSLLTNRGLKRKKPVNEETVLSEQLTKSKVVSNRNGHRSIGPKSKRSSVNARSTVQRSVANKLKNKAKRLADKGSVSKGHTAPISTHHNKLQISCESDTDSYSTLSDANQTDGSDYQSLINTSKELDSEDTFLHYLAANMQEITEFPAPVKRPTDKQITSVEDTARSQQDMEIEQNTESNPEAVSVTTIAEMFKQLQKEVGEMRQELKDIKSEKNEQVSEEIIGKCMDKLKETASGENFSDKKELNKLRDDLKHFKFRNRALVDTVDRMNNEIEDLRSRLENVEINTSRKAVTISGLHVNSTRKYEMAKEVEEFIDKELGVYTVVEDIYKMGVAEPKMLVVHFQSMQHKNDVMHFKSHLRFTRNRHGRKYYINEYLPITTQERKKRERQIIQENNDSQTPLEIKYTRNGLTLQGETYQPKVSVPTPKQIVDLSPQELKRILEFKVDFAEPLQKDKSIFQTYVADVTEYSQIRDLYVKLKLMQPTARHIVCSYFLEGAETHYTKGFCDDGEPGAGKAVLDFLVRNNIKNKVAFATRKFGGIKMGAERFTCYVEATRQTITKFPYNTVLKINQHCDKEVDQGKKDAAPAPDNSTSSSARGKGVHNSRGAARSFKPGTRPPQYQGQGNTDYSQGRTYHRGRSPWRSYGSIRGAYQSTQQRQTYHQREYSDPRDYDTRGDWADQSDGDYYWQKRLEGESYHDLN